jgi:hypothetical protein
VNRAGTADVFSLVLDGTDCPINRPHAGIQRGFYSGKSKKHCIKYEVGVHPQTGHLVWVGGPVPGSVHDLTITRLFGILTMLMAGEFILADKGYIGEWQIITPFKGKSHQLTVMEKEVNLWLGSIRWIVEHVLLRIKNFHCVNIKWRHARELHSTVFFVICEIVNIDMYFRPVRK